MWYIFYCIEKFKIMLIVNEIIFLYYFNIVTINRIGVVIVSMLASSPVDRGFKSIIDYQIGICCFSAKHQYSGERSTAGWLGIRIMCPEWDDNSIRGLLFQWARTVNEFQLSVLVYCKADLIIISLKISLFSTWYSWTNCWNGA